MRIAQRAPGLLAFLSHLMWAQASKEAWSLALSTATRETATTLADIGSNLADVNVCNSTRARLPASDLGDAVLIEPRQWPILALTLLNVRAHLPASWTLHLFTADVQALNTRWMDQATHGAHPALLRSIDLRHLLLHPLPKRLLSVQAPHNQTTVRGTAQRAFRDRAKLAYNIFLASEEFWSIFNRRWLLLFEVDSVLCANPTWPLEHFIRSEPSAVFWGAPWKWNHGMDVGNSGLSLWRRDVMQNLSTEFEKFARLHKGPAPFAIDGGLHVFLEAMAKKGKLALRQHALREDAAMFSVETSYPKVSNNTQTGSVLYTPFGVHAPFKLIGTQGLESFVALIRKCPASVLYYTNTSRIAWPKLQALAMHGGRYFNETQCDLATNRLQRGPSIAC